MIYLIGGRGRLGKAINKYYQKKDIHLLDRSTYEDWWQDGSFENIQQYFEPLIDNHRSNILFIAAGVLDPSAPSDDIHRVNFLLPKQIINGLTGSNIKVVTFGTVMEKLVSGVSSNPYIQSKYLLSEYISSLDSALYDVLHIRVHTLYGNGKPSPFMFLGQIFNALKNQKEFEMSSGVQLREYHHINDDVRAIEKIVLADEKGIFELNHGAAITLRELACSIFEAFDKAHLLRVGALPSPQEDNFHTGFAKPAILDGIYFRNTTTGVVDYLKNLIKLEKQ